MTAANTDPAMIAVGLSEVAEWLDAFALRFRDEWGRTAQQAEIHAAALRSLVSADQVLDEVRRTGAQQSELAAQLGISAAYLSDVLRGRRGISDALAERIGFERVVLFRRTIPGGTPQ